MKGVLGPVEINESIRVEGCREGDEIVGKFPTAVVENIRGVHRPKDREIFHTLADYKEIQYQNEGVRSNALTEKPSVRTSRNSIIQLPSSRRVEKHVTLDCCNPLELGSKSIFGSSVERRSSRGVGGIQCCNFLYVGALGGRKVNFLQPRFEFRVGTRYPSISGRRSNAKE